MSEQDKPPIPGSAIPSDGSESNRSRTAGMVAHQAKLIDFRGPKDWRLTAARRQVRDELTRGWAEFVTPPEDDQNVYYFGYALRPNGRVPFLIPEGQFLPFLLGLAVGMGWLDLANLLTYQEAVLPAGTEPPKTVG